MLAKLDRERKKEPAVSRLLVSGYPKGRGETPGLSEINREHSNTLKPDPPHE